MSKIIQAMEEAVAIAKGEIPAARITTNGHTYVPLKEYERLRAALQQIVDEADSDYGMTGGDAADVARMALAYQQTAPTKEGNI